MSKRTRRTAYSLLEMLAVIATASIILGAVSTIIYSTLRTASDAADIVGRSRSLAQFEIQFRRDVRAGSIARINDATLVIERADHSAVHYSQTNTDIERRAATVDGQTLSREIYRIEVPLVAKWELSPGQPTFVSLSFEPRPDEFRLSSATRALRVSAELGRDDHVSAPARLQEAP